jgi:hypothetical protein
MRTLLLFVAAMGLSACPASIEGEIDGSVVPALQSASFTESALGSASARRTIVTGTAISVQDGCNSATEQQQQRTAAFEQFLAATSGESDVDKVKQAQLELVEAQASAARALPATYWTAVVSASAADPDDLDRADSEIDVDDPDPDQDVQSSVRVCRVNAHPAVDEDDNGFPVLSPDEDCFVAVTGDVALEEWEERETLVAAATVTLARSDALDDEVGDVVIRLTASHCPSLESALDDFEDIIDE